MRLPRFASLVVFALFAPFASAQQTATSSTQALTLLQSSLGALTSGRSITDITLSGSARRIAGSDDETGTGTVKALAGTGTRIDLILPSGIRSELRNTSSASPVGSWSGPDTVWHPISNHNLLNDPGWFPAFADSIASDPKRRRHCILLWMTGGPTLMSEWLIGCSRAPATACAGRNTGSTWHTTPIQTASSSTPSAPTRGAIATGS